MTSPPAEHARAEQAQQHSPSGAEKSPAHGTARASWIYLRAYLLVAALIIVTGGLLDYLLAQRHAQAIEHRELSLIKNSFDYVELQLAQQNQLNAQTLSKNLRLPALWLPVDDFSALPGDQLQQLYEQVLILYDSESQPVFYRFIAAYDMVLALGPLPPAAGGNDYWVAPLFFLLVALAVFLWLRPLSKDLDHLQEAAHSFGAQQFGKRVAIGNSSWLLPLAEAFNSMAQRIQWLLQSHRELTHAVSHELRTPLARLRFSLEMLESSSTADSSRHRASMNRDIEELNTLVEEMLHYAELNDDNLNAKLESVEIGPWIELYLADYGPLNSDVRLHLKRCPANGSVLLDTRLIKRALDNLLGNALRYAKSEIQVFAGVCDGRCRIIVRDDGPGIPVEQRQSVMGAFNRLNTDTKQDHANTGFGLGLAIVTRIMQLHNGSLHIDTSPSGGADMILDWPINRP